MGSSVAIISIEYTFYLEIGGNKVKRDLNHECLGTIIDKKTILTVDCSTRTYTENNVNYNLDIQDAESYSYYVYLGAYSLDSAIFKRKFEHQVEHIHVS